MPLVLWAAKGSRCVAGTKLSAWSALDLGMWGTRVLPCIFFFSYYPFLLEGTWQSCNFWVVMVCRLYPRGFNSRCKGCSLPARKLVLLHNTSSLMPTSNFDAPRLQSKHLPTYGGYKDHQPFCGYPWEDLGAEKQAVIKEMLERNLHNKLSEKQGQFSFVKVVCNGKGQESSCPVGLTQEMPPTLTPALRTQTQEASLKCSEKKICFCH